MQTVAAGVTASHATAARELLLPPDCCRPQVVGTSETVGKGCGSWTDQTTRRAGDITKVNLYYDGRSGCVTGERAGSASSSSIPS